MEKNYPCQWQWQWGRLGRGCFREARSLDEGLVQNSDPVYMLCDGGTELQLEEEKRVFA